MIIYGSASSLLLIGVVCVRGMPESYGALFEVAWVMPSGVVELLAYWSGKFNQHRNGAIWNMIPHCLMSIWLERNSRIF